MSGLEIEAISDVFLSRGYENPMVYISPHTRYRNRKVTVVYLDNGLHRLFEDVFPENVRLDIAVATTLDSESDVVID